MIGAAISPHRTFLQRTVDCLKITYFSQAPGSTVPRHFHENGTLCIPLHGAARDHFSERAVEYEPGSVIYRPPGERHSHEFGKDAVVAIVIEIPTSRLRGDSALHMLSEIRFRRNAPEMLAASARLLNSLRTAAPSDINVEEHCLSLLAAFVDDPEQACDSKGVERVRELLDESILDALGNCSPDQLLRPESLHKSLP